MKIQGLPGQGKRWNPAELVALNERWAILDLGTRVPTGWWLQMSIRRSDGMRVASGAVFDCARRTADIFRCMVRIEQEQAAGHPCSSG